VKKVQEQKKTLGGRRKKREGRDGVCGSSELGTKRRVELAEKIWNVGK